MTVRFRLLCVTLLVATGTACGTPVITAQHQPHIRYPSAPPPESTETAYTRELRQKLAGEAVALEPGEDEPVDATVRRLYR